MNISKKQRERTRLMKPHSLPLLPVFDAMRHVKNQALAQAYHTLYAIEDFKQAKAFLLSYKGNEATFNAYRREVERLLHWTWLIAKKSIRELKRADIEAYIEFCQNPPLAWIGIKKASRYIVKEAQRLPNPEWRPFVATVSKADHRKGKEPDVKAYTLSQKSIQEIFTITGSFYNFLIQEDYTEANPVLHVRQKSRYVRKSQGKPIVRRLSELQWSYVI